MCLDDPGRFGRRLVLPVWLGHVPIEKKLNLTIREAAEYSNIGMNKINEMLRNPMCSFVLYVGAKKLVKRKEFEQFLAGRMEI